MKDKKLNLCNEKVSKEEFLDSIRYGVKDAILFMTESDKTIRTEQFMEAIIETVKGSIILNNEDRDLFLETLKNPPAPNEKFKKMLKDFMKEKSQLMKNLSEK